MRAAELQRRPHLFRLLSMKATVFHLTLPTPPGEVSLQSRVGLPHGYPSEAGPL